MDDKSKATRTAGIRRTEALQTLCNFMRNVSREWDIEETKKLSAWYIDDYYRQLLDEPDQGYRDSIQERYNATLLHTLSLWSDYHFLCPLIHEFNLRCLQTVDDATLSILLPQLLFSVNTVEDTALIKMLLGRMSKNVSSYVRSFWMLVVEIEREARSDLSEPLPGKASRRCFADAMSAFIFSLPTERKDILTKQGILVRRLVEISGTMRQSRGSTKEKKEMMRAIINGSDDLLLFDPVPLPIDGDVVVIAVVPEECSVFHSQLTPLLLSFLTKEGKIYKCIFKTGDDLRQDELVIQILKVSRSVLENNGHSCDNVIIYDVVATGMEHGFVQFVPSESLDNILQNPKGLERVLATRRNSDTLDHEKMMRFVESTAFYTVVTYLLCIGDRHLDNILLTKEGKLFHIDFGFIGREPKPFAPAVKLCPEMIDVMGGKFSGYYGTFMRRCTSCYLILRKNSHVVLNLLELMADAGIPDVNPKTIEKIRGRFCLDLPDKEAISQLTSDIERGFQTILPKMMDNFHHTWKVVNGGTTVVLPKDGRIALVRVPKQMEKPDLKEWCLIEPDND